MSINEGGEEIPPISTKADQRGPIHNHRPEELRFRLEER